MHLFAMDDNTKIVLLALIAGIPSWVSLVISALIRRNIATPSGDPIGKVAEETHAIAHANGLAVTQMHEKIVNGEARGV